MDTMEDEAGYKHMIVQEAEAQISTELAEQSERRREQKRQRKMVKKTVQEEYVS